MMKLSARNHIKGTVKSVEEGAIMANVKIEIDAPDTITSVITKETIKDLDIKEGDKVIVIVKSTVVMVGKE